MTTKGKDGNSVLDWAPEYPELLAASFKNLPEGARFEAMRTKNSKGLTVWDQVLDHPESLKTVLETLPKPLCANVVKNLLYLAVNYPASLKALLDLCPAEEHLAAVTTKAIDGLGSVLDKAVENIESLGVFLKILSICER